MNAMKIPTICLAVAGGVTGIIAAHYWRESSRISVNPSGFEPLEQADKAMYWTGGAMEAFTQSAELNKKAAQWTAVSVLLSAFSGVIGNIL